MLATLARGRPCEIFTPLAVAILAFGLASQPYSVTPFSYRLAITPGALQGRVNSVARMIANSLSPLGLALTGIMLQSIGPTPMVLLIASWQVLAARAATFDPHIRRAPPVTLKPVADQTVSA